MWRNGEEVGVGDVLRGLSAKALVWGDVDPLGSGLGARYADDSMIVVEVRASTLFECRGGVKDAHACEIVGCLTYDNVPDSCQLEILKSKGLSSSFHGCVVCSFVLFYILPWRTTSAGQ